MTSFRDWFWQLEETGKGPDHLFTATFEPTQAGRLKIAVREWLPSGFVANSDFLDFHRYRACQFYESYLDLHTHDLLQSMRASGLQQNIYISSSIDVCDHTLNIENLYARHETAETEFLIGVVLTAGLTLQFWTIVAAGDGYDPIEVARGDSAVSLLGYLQYVVQ